MKAKILQASTSEVYGDPTLHPQQETYRGNVNPIGPRACYDEGKRCAETLFFDYHRQHKVKIRVVRIFNTYGPRMHPNDGRVVSNFIVQALKNEPITLYGDGSQTRAFCYVDDLVEGFLRMMDAPDEVTGPMNLGNPVETSVAELAQLVIGLTGSRSKIPHKPLPVDDPIQRCPDISQAKSAQMGAEDAAQTRPRTDDRLFRQIAHRPRRDRESANRWSRRSVGARVNSRKVGNCRTAAGGWRSAPSPARCGCRTPLRYFLRAARRALRTSGRRAAG